MRARLLLPVLVAALLGLAACGDAPTGVRAHSIAPLLVCTRADTTWIEAVGPVPEGSWIRVPIVRSDTIPC